MELVEWIAAPVANACDFLAAAGNLPKGRIKDAMNKGAVWLRRGKGGWQRLRRATTALRAGDEIALYYDPALLALKPPGARCLHRERHYSVWFKPAGLLAQGTHYGDHCALLRQAEVQLGRPLYLVHRLDREAEGLMLLAHGADAAARLSRLFREQQVEKLYRVEVRGDPGAQGRIDSPLDGKPALSEFTRLAWDAQNGTALLQVRIHTGRKHQIRRHFAALGHPVAGDPRYGGGRHPAGLRLAAVRLAFVCPYSGQPKVFDLAQAAHVIETS